MVFIIDEFTQSSISLDEAAFKVDVLRSGQRVGETDTDRGKVGVTEGETDGKNEERETDGGKRDKN